MMSLTKNYFLPINKVLFSNSQILVFLLFIITASCQLNAQENVDKENTIVFNYLDFEQKKGAIPFYKDKWRKAIAINAGKYKNKFSAAILKFNDKSGNYLLQLTTFREEDGESTYKIFIDNKLIKTYKNPETDKNFEQYTFPSETVSLKKGSIIEIQFNSHSNGKIPENGGFAFSRGRVKSIELASIK